MTQLDDYIVKARGAGLSDEAIKNELLKAGWDESVIGQSFGQPAQPPTTAGATSAWHNLPASFEQHFTRPGLWAKIKLPVIIGVAVVVIAAGAYFAYNSFFGASKDLWSDAVEKTFSSPYMHVSVEGEIGDVIPADGADDFLDFSGIFGQGRVAIGLKNVGDFKIQPGKQVNYSSVLTLSWRVGGLNMSVDFDIKKIAGDYYFKTSGTPLFAEFFDMSGGDGQQEWLRLNL